MCACEIDKNSKSITDNSVVTCDTILDAVAKSYENSANFNEKNISWNIGNFYILFVFLLITISLLIIVSVY